MKYWSKSALSIYRYLESMADTVDKKIVNTGSNSNNECLQKYQTTYFQTNQIIELLERKRKLINLKVAVEDALANLSTNDRRLLVLSHIDGVTSISIAQLLNISLRTFFRWKVNALNKFASEMRSLGYDEKFFDTEYSNEIWFMSVYNEILSFEITDDCLAKIVVNKMFKQISKVAFKKVMI